MRSEHLSSAAPVADATVTDSHGEPDAVTEAEIGEAHDDSSEQPYVLVPEPIYKSQTPADDDQVSLSGAFSD